MFLTNLVRREKAPFNFLRDSKNRVGDHKKRPHRIPERHPMSKSRLDLHSLIEGRGSHRVFPMEGILYTHSVNCDILVLSCAIAFVRHALLCEAPKGSFRSRLSENSRCEYLLRLLCLDESLGRQCWENDRASREIGE
jgi:hypothetical protein